MKPPVHEADLMELSTFIAAAKQRFAEEDPAGYALQCRAEAEEAATARALTANMNGNAADLEMCMRISLAKQRVAL